MGRWVASLCHFLRLSANPERVGGPHEYRARRAGFSEQVTDSSQTSQFASADALGSIRLITDGSGNVVGTGSYSPWGVPDTGSVTQNGFGFAGEQIDPESGFIYLRNRLYDPTTSRFLTPDPLGAAGSGVNLYAYVGNNPATLTDPTGLCFAPDAGEGGGGCPGAGPGAGPGGDLGGFGSGEGSGSEPAPVVDPEELTVRVPKESAPAWTEREIGPGEGLNCPTEAEQGSKFVPTMDPYDIRFSQSSIKGSFRDGGSIQDLVEGLRSGSVQPDDVSPIRIYEKDGKLYTLDNRRLEAFRQAGVDIPYRWATPEEISENAWKFTTQNDGTSIRIRGDR